MKKLLFALFIGILVLVKQPAYADTTSAISNGLSYLRSQQQLDGHIDGFAGVSDWAAQAFILSGTDISTVSTTSGQTLLQYLECNPPTQSASSSDWSRRILTISALNKNPYTFGGTDEITGLQTYYNNNQIGDTSADNDDMFGLMALLSGNVSTASAIVTDTTNFILSHQHGDGGFSYATDNSTGSDIDDTAAAIMALVAAKHAGLPIAQSAIENAKTYILSHQNQDGGFAYDPNPATSWDTTSNVSTTSWVIMALTSLGATSDAQTVSAKNYVVSSQQPDGSFPYQPAFPPGDTFDTSFALLALSNAFWPSNVYAGNLPTSTPTPTISVTPPVTPTITDTPTPTTIVSITDTPTPQPTAQPTTTPTPSPIPTSSIYANLASETSKTIDTPSVIPTSYPTQAVLGIQSKKTDQQPFPFITIGFILLGFIFSTLQLLRLKRQ